MLQLCLQYSYKILSSSGTILVSFINETRNISDHRTPPDYFMESQNTLGWKESVRITELHSLLLTGLPRDQKHCPDSPRTLTGLSAMTTSLGSLVPVTDIPLSEEPFSDIQCELPLTLHCIFSHLLLVNRELSTFPPTDSINSEQYTFTSINPYIFHILSLCF